MIIQWERTTEPSEEDIYESDFKVTEFLNSIRTEEEWEEYSIRDSQNWVEEVVRLVYFYRDTHIPRFNREKNCWEKPVNVWWTYNEYLQTPHWKEVRQQALQKYGGKCALNDKHPDAVHVHHRNYQRLGAELPEDVIVLCASCHAKHHDKANSNGMS